MFINTIAAQILPLNIKYLLIIDLNSIQYYFIQLFSDDIV